MAEPRRVTVGFRDTEGLRALCGERDSNLRALESRLGIQVFARGTELTLQGAEAEIALGAEVLGALFSRARAGVAVQIGDFDDWLDSNTRVAGPTAVNGRVAQMPKPTSETRDSPVRPLQLHRPRPLNKGVEEGEANEGTRRVQPQTEGQKRYVEQLQMHDVVFGVGPAGSGKTYLAMAAAVAALHRREVKRIVLTRPAVEAGEHLGFLPGDLAEKVSPYLRPLYDALRDLVDEDKFARLTERGQIEVAPLAFMRGRTLANSYIILDEAQNCTVEQMMMLLTRMGDHSKIIVTGDPTQSDLPRGARSGLGHALGILEGVVGIGIVRLGIEDVVRHPLVGRIVKAYADDRARSNNNAFDSNRRPDRGDAPAGDSKP